MLTTNLPEGTYNVIAVGTRKVLAENLSASGAEWAIKYHHGPGFAMAEVIPVTVQWENGVFASNEISVADKSAAFAKIDQIMRDAECPDSIVAQIKVAGEVVWQQHGTRIEVNR